MHWRSQVIPSKKLRWLFLHLLHDVEFALGHLAGTKTTRCLNVSMQKRLELFWLLCWCRQSVRINKLLLPGRALPNLRITITLAMKVKKKTIDYITAWRSDTDELDELAFNLGGGLDMHLVARLSSNIQSGLPRRSKDYSYLVFLEDQRISPSCYLEQCLERLLGSCV